MHRSRVAELFRLGLCLTVGLATFAVVSPAQVAGAATVLVTSCADSGAGSLRAAVASASSGDTIMFAAPSTFNPACTTANTITLASPINIATNTLTIQGPGASSLAISGGKTTQIFDNTATGVTISELTVENGTGTFGGAVDNHGSLTIAQSALSNNDAFFGGAILNQASLTIDQSALSNNGDGGANGGAILNEGSLAITNSTLSKNDGVFGGAIQSGGPSPTTTTITNSTLSNNGDVNTFGGAIDNSGAMTVTNSTVANNNAASGGGINNEGSLTLTNSTLANNRASDNGGGIANTFSGLPPTATVTNTTFSNNHAVFGGGGIYNGGSTVLRVGASIFDDSTCVDFGTSTDLGYNISDVATAAPCASLGVVSSSALGLDPAGLASNGGLTQTIALESGSVAIGRVPASSGLCATTDQRGVARPIPCDVGAYQHVGQVWVVVFTGNVARPTITVFNPTAIFHGSNFGAAPSAVPAGCGASGSDYVNNDLYLLDTTQGWNAGQSASPPASSLDCIGLTVSRYTRWLISFGFGNWYDSSNSTSMLKPGDVFSLGVYSKICSGTVPPYPGIVLCQAF